MFNRCSRRTCMEMLDLTHAPTDIFSQSAASWKTTWKATLHFVCNKCAYNKSTRYKSICNKIICHKSTFHKSSCNKSILNKSTYDESTCNKTVCNKSTFNFLKQPVPELYPCLVCRNVYLCNICMYACIETFIWQRKRKIQA